DAVVRTHKHRAPRRDDAQIPSAGTDAGIDDHKVNGVGNLVDAGRCRGRTLADVEWGDVMAEVDDVRLRASSEDHRMAHADPRVVQAVIRNEADGGLHLASDGQRGARGWTTMMLPVMEVLRGPHAPTGHHRADVRRPRLERLC